MISTDSVIQLSIPAGALSSNTDITIQPVSNECPGGIGLGYDLLPNGTRFAVPATLTFHYTDNEMDGTDPLFCFIAFQDSLQQWNADVVNGGIDTVAKTVFLDINHFTQYVKFRIVSITSTSNNHMLLENESATLTVKSIKPNSQSTTSSSANAGEDYLPPLPIETALSNSIVSGWAIDPKHGQLAGDGNSAIYTAPSSIQAIERIRVSCRVKINDIITDALVTKSRNKNAKSRFRGHDNSSYMGLTTSLMIRPTNITYRYKMEYQKVRTSGVFDDVYYDSMGMEIDIRGYDITIPSSSITNIPPTVSKTVGDDGLTEATWMKDNYGELNTLSATGVFQYKDEERNYYIVLDFVGQNQQRPRWQWKDLQSGIVSTPDVQYFPDDSWSGLSFAMTDQTLIWEYGKSNDFFRYTVTPIH